MTTYKNIYYQVSDGLQLYARDYNQADSDQVLLCMHGLSRNSADFEPLCSLLSDHYRMIVVDQRGRGLSQWDENPERYQLPTYVADMWSLLDQLGLDKVTLIGTSMGGLMGMVMAAEKPDRIQGLVINDVGPEVAPQGLARIMSYVGKAKPIRNWGDAIEQTQAINQVCFPSFTQQQWQAMAERLYREDSEGVPVPSYDPKISQPIASDEAAAVPPDLWPLFEQLRVPMLAIRGQLSDLLSAECFARMQEVQPATALAVVEGVGHAPVLDEPQAIAAIRGFLTENLA
ncbi:MAG: alpha/beta hydrolase [Cellvibrionaceae bacterium]|nr:alpha/beta hydrolase [Cellvibrionaceae bacterium]|tara:strand:+ start:12838 stop:13698 length:861 start_codon:yes stop_codon:yes gene_type:complete